MDINHKQINTIGNKINLENYWTKTDKENSIRNVITFNYTGKESERVGNL